MQKDIQKKLKDIHKSTDKKRDKMKFQIADGNIANSNFKDLEYIIYSTIK